MLLIEILVVFENDHTLSWRSAPDIDPLPLQDDPLQKNMTRLYSFDSVARHSLANSVLDPEASGRRSFSDPLVPLSGIGIGVGSVIRGGIGNGIGDGIENGGNESVSLRKQFSQEEEFKSLGHKLKRPIVVEERFKASDNFSLRNTLSQAKDKTAHQTGNSLNPSEIYQLYETKISHLTKKNTLLEEQLRVSIKAKEAIEKDLSEAINGKEESEKRLEETLKVTEYLKEKVLGLELAQEEANLVHDDNVKLEHDVAFLKFILDDTQKELLSTRGVLAGERQRSLQLQMEMYHLKQRMKIMETRAPTPRKQHNV